MNSVLKYKDFFSYIKEGLIKTYPIKTTIKLINRELNGLIFSVDSETETNTIFIKLLSSDINIDRLISIYRVINLCGYFVSNYDFYNSSDNVVGYLAHDDDLCNNFNKELIDKVNNSHFTQVTIESRYNNKIVSKTDILYHVTSKKNKYKIEKMGLVPKSKNKRANHNDRIYLGFNSVITKNLSYQLSKGEYILLKINTNGLDISFYDDPDFIGNGFYTYDNIPRENIEIIEEFSV